MNQTRDSENKGKSEHNNTPSSSKGDGETLGSDVLREELNQLQAEFGKLLKTFSSFADKATSSGLREGRGAVERVGEQAVEVRDRLAEQIKAKPMMAIGIAAAAGFLLAAMRRK
jgi:ElaB/YqjD/DUF883 family membrane-anchored ribosome-binding protein